MQRRIVIAGYQERLEEAVGQSGLSKNEIARRMGMDRKVLLTDYHYCQMGSGALMKFCAVTGVSADWMLGLRKEMKL